jgi:hypothetical protein
VSHHGVLNTGSYRRQDSANSRRTTSTGERRAASPYDEIHINEYYVWLEVATQQSKSKLSTNANVPRTLVSATKTES